ncbi:MAG: UDP-N-acetylenolpyruvoylglucosamine reductase [Bacteroidia bacterium]|nr:UDP-N-acetylenolpyruvoylglucosamine reductase [Bacteroidia bacterium]
MNIREGVSLRQYNTFGIAAKAKFFAEISALADAREICSHKQFVKTDKLILGGGSNILFTKDFDGIVIKNNFKGIEVVAENSDNIFVKSGAGENWHNFVLHCIENNYAGVENLSLIPGNVGASPMQNIGAYGVEIKDVFHELEAFEIATAEQVKFSAADCNFGYRESVFKNKHRNKFIITSVTFRLNRIPKFNISYGAIEQELEKMGVKELSISSVSKAVCNIRSSKLPDPKQIGNAGSFFKNPVISQELYENIKKEFANVVAYPSGNEVKLAAGWLIEQCGWKGYRKNDCGVHMNQALVLVNYGNASGDEIFNLSQEVMDSVNKKFGVTLEREVNIV